MLKNKWISLLLITFFMTFVFVPASYVAAVQMDDIVAEIEALYSYADKEYENYNIPAIEAALERLVELDEEQLEEIAGPLITDEVTAKYQDNLDLYDRSEWTRVITELMAFTYLGNPDAVKLKDDLDKFREEFSPHFRILFGEGITMEDLARLAQDTRSQIRSVIGEAEAGILANDPNNIMIEKMTGFMYDALDAAVDLPGNEMFAGKVAELGWGKDLLIQQLDILSGYIDQDGDARRSIALIAIRSETELVDGPLIMDVGDKPEYTVTIMGENATSLIAWDSTNQGVVEVTTDEDTGNFILEAVGPGTAELIVYRDYTGAKPDFDWLYRFEVTVKGPACMYGDVNCDGEITVTDAVLILKHITDGITLNMQQQIVGDVDGNKEITVTDAVLILKHITDPSVPFPVEQFD